MDNDIKLVVGAGCLAGFLGMGVFGASMLRVAKPSQYLVQTGLRITGTMGMRVSRQAFVIPICRKLQIVEMAPRNLHFTLKCLSEEYLPFNLPVTFTVSPHDPASPNQTELIESHARTNNEDSIVLTPVPIASEDLFKRFVQKIEPLSDTAFESLLLGVIHGTTRNLAAKMPIDSINNDRDMFNAKIIVNVQQLLMQYGLKVDNANIAELSEEKRGNSKGYLESREQKKLSEAVQQSEVFVAESTKEGDIGKKQREADTRQVKAQLEAKTRQIEFDTQQQIAISSANLEVVKSASKQREEVSRIEANAAALLCKEELQLQIETKREDQLLVAKRADQLTSNKVAAQCLMVEAQAKGDASMAEALGKAQSIETIAKATRFEGEQKAAVIFANLKAEADGKLALLMAQAQGTQELVKACNNDPETLRTLLNIYNEIPQTIARESAKAVQNLNPQIWSLSGDSAGSQIANMLASLSPMIDMYKKVTTNKE